MSAEPQPTPIGDAVDATGLTMTMEPGELITGAYVLVRYVDAEGLVGMRAAHAGLDWMTRHGMLHVANLSENHSTGKIL